MRGFDSHLNLQKLEVFCLVAEMLSITRAANQLCVSQPVVTAHIRSLEDKLGATLLRREGRGIALTQEGTRVLRWATGVVTRTRELERELAGASAAGPGQAIVAASMSAGCYIVPGLVCEFHARYRADRAQEANGQLPGKVQVIVSTPQAALDAVRSGACDFAVTLISPDQNVDGVHAEPLWNEPLLLVSAADSRWVHGVIDRDWLSHVPFISTSSAVMQQLEEGLLLSHGVATRNVVLELGHPEAQKEAVTRDMGVCFFLQSSVARDLERGDLRLVDTPQLHLGIPLYIVSRKDKELSPFQLALRDHIRSAHPPGVTTFDAQALAA